LAILTCSGSPQHPELLSHHYIQISKYINIDNHKYKEVSPSPSPPNRCHPPILPPTSLSGGSLWAGTGRSGSVATGPGRSGRVAAGTGRSGRSALDRWVAPIIANYWQAACRRGQADPGVWRRGQADSAGTNSIGGWHLLEARPLRPPPACLVGAQV